MPRSKSPAAAICIVVLPDSQMFNPMGATPMYRVTLHTAEDKLKLDEYLLSHNARGYNEDDYGKYFWNKRNCKKPREISLDSFLRKGITL